jgi:hypothetical protein
LWEYDQVRAALPELSAQVGADGTVELSGYVRSDLIRDGVIETLRRVRGVAEIVDRLYSDEQLELAVAGELAKLKQLPPGMISIRGHLGQVTLIGRLPDESLRGKIVDLANSIPGVEQVVDRMDGGD